MQHALKNRWVKISAQALVLTALVLGLVSFVAANKTVALVVDGESRDVSTFGKTVADVLAASDIQLAARDEVTPALDAAVDDGTVVEVNRSKAVSVSIDGVDRVVHTTGMTVADILAQLRVEGASEVSLGSQMELASLSTPIEITTPKAVALTVDGKTRKLTTTVDTVEDLLAEARVKLGASDELSAKPAAKVADGLKLKVVRVETKKKTKTQAVAHGTTTVEDAGLYRGKSQLVRAGKDGVRTLTYKVVVKDGKTFSTQRTSSKVTTAPVAEKIAVGTKERPKPKPKPQPVAEPQAAPQQAAAQPKAAPQAAPKAAPQPAPKPAPKASPSSSGGTTASAASVSGAWAALAQCESGGNWAINTGNGYYGGLQFSLSSWQGVGGTQYAAFPHQATPAQQIAAAEKLRANGGWGHWPACSSKLGLR
ncbi:transglycosylase family protein [Arthrobacter halodurans]|uniref:Transglycosylase family protein n=1 Tax=Arthrobacter halodurans TaxID=516699 RepID=A0ABV4USU1_9MICC